MCMFLLLWMLRSSCITESATTFNPWAFGPRVDRRGVTSETAKRTPRFLKREPNAPGFHTDLQDYASHTARVLSGVKFYMKSTNTAAWAPQPAVRDVDMRSKNIIKENGVNKIRAASKTYERQRLSFGFGWLLAWLLEPGAKRADVVVEEMCSFSIEEPAFAPWDGPGAQYFDIILEAFHRATAKVILLDGSLLGAYRHRGTIPFDEDVDVVFDICENRHLITSSSFLSGMSCSDIAEVLRKRRNNTLFQQVWDDMLAPIVKTDRKSLAVHLLDVNNYGVRISVGKPQWDGGQWDHPPSGVGMDLSFVAMEGKPVSCVCKYGKTFAFCPENSRDILLQRYGPDFMTPKSQCDFYEDLAKKERHENWNTREDEECDWAPRGETDYHPSTFLLLFGYLFSVVILVCVVIASSNGLYSKLSSSRATARTRKIREPSSSESDSESDSQ